MILLKDPNCSHVPPESEVPQTSLFLHVPDCTLLESPARQPEFSHPVWEAHLSFSEPKALSGGSAKGLIRSRSGSRPECGRQADPVSMASFSAGCMARSSAGCMAGSEVGFIATSASDSSQDTP